ncbi:MAG: hypothetical protein CL799_05120 [Chromatiales bacterium]|jgi:uncharacterized membrane protein|nr:hypothetical protein [Chromatiales bacterium]MDP6149794.1 hypothetical protein [Gammaproteobacteria bacterium]HJP04104.1 hypothetical protein [Gammaproteobacteria bacterium]
MEAVVAARIVHVLGVVLWIGGVWFVTTVIIPSVIEDGCGEESIKLFERVEDRFAWQSRIIVLITGLSGFYMLYVANSWSLFLNSSYWWLFAMSLVWLAFTLLLFVLEPLFLHRWFMSAIKRAPQSTFRRMNWLHWVMLVLSLVTIAGTVAGSHGWLWL